MIQKLALDLRTAKRLTNGSANDFLTLGSFNHFKFGSHASHWGEKSASFTQNLHVLTLELQREIGKRTCGELWFVFSYQPTPRPQRVPQGRLCFFIVTPDREDFDPS